MILRILPKQDVKSKVISIIVDKLGVDEGEVTNEASFTNDLGAGCISYKNQFNWRYTLD
ncbi:acyl carrier protein [bacterium]|nr:acyl carrier protein [bacterium]